VLAVRLPALFPPLDVLALAARAGRFVVGDTFPYTRSAWANRTRIRTPQGWMMLTAPLAGAALGRPLCDVPLAPAATYAPKLVRALQFNYGGSPFHAHYAPEVEALLHTPHPSAAALALASMRWLFAAYGLAPPEAASALPGAPATLAAVVAATGADRLVALPDTAAHDARVAPCERFEPPAPTYRQPFPGFVPGLSALDALFMRGPEARLLL
jgi:hypothetical protein